MRHSTGPLAQCCVYKLCHCCVAFYCYSLALCSPVLQLFIRILGMMYHVGITLLPFITVPFLLPPSLLLLLESFVIRLLLPSLSCLLVLCLLLLWFMMMPCSCLLQAICFQVSSRLSTTVDTLHNYLALFAIEFLSRALR